MCQAMCTCVAPPNIVGALSKAEMLYSNMFTDSIRLMHHVLSSMYA